MKSLSSSIPVRRLSFDLRANVVPRHWNGGEVFRTHFFNAGSVVFEIGEKYFVDVMRQAASVTDDPKLSKEIHSFIGQEANHRRVHMGYNDMLKMQGYDFAGAQTFLSRFSAWQQRRLSLKTQLGFVAAYEHFTTMLSSFALSDPSWLQGADKEMTALWCWHTLEELEHKSVAIDAYRALGGGYVRRCLTMFPATVVFWIGVLWALGALLRRDKSLMSPKVAWQACRFALWRPGMLWRVLLPWLGYFSPRFHPSSHADAHLKSNAMRAIEASWAVSDPRWDTLKAPHAQLG